MYFNNFKYMDDDYVLVSKSQLERLKKDKENLELELKNRQNLFQERDMSEFQKYLKYMLQSIEQGSKKERDIIISNLLQIKEMNKSTLENVLDKTEKVDKKLESMITNLIDLIETLNFTIEELKSMADNSKNFKDKTLNPDMLENFKINEAVMKKLYDIDLFMKNLRVLLSYVKPSDFSINKNYKKD